MKRNHAMMQFFEWHVESDGKHWNRLKELAPKLKSRGIDAVWIPPATKGQSVEDTGYSVYDLYDLGEFDQKGTVRTKYGEKHQLLEAIALCHQEGINVYADVVMNHKAGADEKETFQVIEVNHQDRNEEISKPYDIEGWTKFTFPGRGERYSAFKWSFVHFNGTDYDAKENKMGIYRIVGENKEWNVHVDNEFGNYDYLMFANIDYNHPEVKAEMITWGKWFAAELQCDGYRLDAIKHINYEFLKDFAKEMKQSRGERFYLIGEFWNAELAVCEQFLASVGYLIDIFDVPLHFKLHEASLAGKEFDLTTIFTDTLVDSEPRNTITFVDNHDSQPKEALESWIADLFKQSAYALILLRRDGYPCVFYGDYFHIGGEDPIDGKKIAIDPLLYARYHKAYGEQTDYFDHPNYIGWVRAGVQEITNSGCAVVISNGDEGNKRMFIGAHRVGEHWVDFTNTRKDTIAIEADGYATFPVNASSVSVWALSGEGVEIL